MDFFYFILNNIYIIFQVIFWALIFFWLDFDLFTYILNDHLTIKTILGIILGCSHLFLFRYLFNLVDIDSIYVSDSDNKELENISEKHDFTSCKRCNIFRPRRTHHCRYCNRCILEMDHHCFILNKCIGKNNYRLFIKYLIFMEANTTSVCIIASIVCYNYFSELSLYALIKYVLLAIASFFGSGSLYLYLLFHVYLYRLNYTTLEFIYPKLRPSSQKLSD